MAVNRRRTVMARLQRSTSAPRRIPRGEGREPRLAAAAAGLKCRIARTINPRYTEEVAPGACRVFGTDGDPSVVRPMTGALPTSSLRPRLERWRIGRVPATAPSTGGLTCAPVLDEPW